MSLASFDLMGRLHWSVLWVAAPLCLLVAIDATTRTDLSAMWLRATRAGIGLAGVALLMMLARAALANWQLGAGWTFLPFILAALCLAAHKGGSPTLAMLFVLATAVALMCWAALFLRWLGGPGTVAAVNNALFSSALPLLGAGIAKHLLTKRPPGSPAADAARETEVQQRLAEPDAQEGADKYTRE